MAVTPEVVITMPAHNEEASISSFLTEIAAAFSDISFRLIVVDDRSTDNTRSVLIELTTQDFPLIVSTNQTNLGHGPSTLIALGLALDCGPRFVVATDGDGNISGQTLRHLYNEATKTTPPSVIEGVRTQRDDPWFRKAVSAATRRIVKRYSGKAPQDANTPFRAYPAKALQVLLTRVPVDHMTPNLMISTLVRQTGLNLSEIPITPYKRPGTEEYGSTWQQRFRLIPSLRFLKFCVGATAQWLTAAKGVSR